MATEADKYEVLERIGNLHSIRHAGTGSTQRIHADTVQDKVPLE